MINEMMENCLFNSFNSQIKRKMCVVLVGLGPHAKRIYLPYLKKHRIPLQLVVEIESKEEETKNILFEK